MQRSNVNQFEFVIKANIIIKTAKSWLTQVVSSVLKDNSFWEHSLKTHRYYVYIKYPVYIKATTYLLFLPTGYGPKLATFVLCLVVEGKFIKFPYTKVSVCFKNLFYFKLNNIEVFGESFAICTTSCLKQRSIFVMRINLKSYYYWASTLNTSLIIENFWFFIFHWMHITYNFVCIDFLDPFHSTVYI